jgi:hypothetical protein
VAAAAEPDHGDSESDRQQTRELATHHTPNSTRPRFQPTPRETGRRWRRSVEPNRRAQDCLHHVRNESCVLRALEHDPPRTAESSAILVAGRETAGSNLIPPNSGASPAERIAWRPDIRRAAWAGDTTGRAKDQSAPRPRTGAVTANGLGLVAAETVATKPCVGSGGVSRALLLRACL